MGLISSSIPNFVNGVSQQPFTLRLATQGETQENGLSTVAQGLKKRPGTRYMAKIRNTPFPLNGTYCHINNRDDIEKYVVVIADGDLFVYDLNGVQQTVAFPDGKAYLSTPTADASYFRVVSVADYTFILNRSVTITEDTANTQQPVRGFEALVNVKSGNYGKTYSIILNGVSVASYTTPDGSSPANSVNIATDFIANALYNALVASAPAGFTYSLVGSVLYLKGTADFTISVLDGFNGNAMVAIKDKLQRFSDLPNKSPSEGFVVEVTGDGSSSFDNYFVKYDSNNGKATGVWKETCKPGLSAGVVATTMPFALVREASGTFTFKKLDWEKRKVGDSSSNPQPSFVGRKMRDVFFYRNRLGFLCDENIIFSEAGKYFNFYRSTVTQLLDSDTIDVSVSHNKVSILEHAVPFNKQLLLFSGQTQFVMEQNDILSPKTVSVKQSTEFPCNVLARPIGVGKNVYFAVNKGDWAALREYFADFNNLSNDSVDVTAHVPKYIPQNIYKLTVSPNEDALCALSKNDRSTVYVYKYFWSNNEKLQSAWSKWTFPATTQVLNAEFIQSELVMVVNRPSGAYLEKVNIAVSYTEPFEPFPVLLDRKVLYPGVGLTYDPVTNRTLLTSYTAASLYDSGETLWAVTCVGGTVKAGLSKQVFTDGSTFYVEGNVAGTDLIVGRQFTFRYTLSTITVKAAQAGGGQKSDTEGRLQIRKVAFNYADTGFFDVKVTPHNRSTYSYRYSGRTLGNETSTIGQPSFDTGRFIVPVMTRNTDTAIVIENSSPVPCSLLSADWEGFYVKRSQPI